MAKTSGGKVNIEALQAKVLALSGEASGGIDALMEEVKDIRAKAREEAAEVERKAEERVKLIQSQIEPLNELYKSATGRYYVNAPGKSKGGGGGGGGRQRRSREDLETLAGQVVASIKGAGKDGISGAELKGKHGQLLPSVKAFLTEYAPDAKVKTTGAKAQTRYHL